MGVDATATRDGALVLDGAATTGRMSDYAPSYSRTPMGSPARVAESPCCWARRWTWRTRLTGPGRWIRPAVPITSSMPTATVVLALDECGGVVFGRAVHSTMDSSQWTVYIARSFVDRV